MINKTDHPTLYLLFFFFNDTATTEIYTLSLHDALPISYPWRARAAHGKSDQAHARTGMNATGFSAPPASDRKSTRLNSSHGYISYAVFCLKKKTLQKLRVSSRRRRHW